MERASVVLLPSRRDPWPLAGCEALISRRPLIAGQGVGSVRDLQALAGDAVIAMRSQDAAGLLQAATIARSRHVGEDLRLAFTPEASAAKIASAVRQR
jgi:glycosyltransferase involved in cell wall biosynthesis